MGFPNTCFCAQSAHIFRYSSRLVFFRRWCSKVCLWLQLLSGNLIWICWGRPQWLRHPGHTLIPADLRAFFSIPRLSESWKPCPARCLETRLLPVSHPAVAFSDRTVSLGLEVDLECFRTPAEKNRTLSMEIELPYPTRLLHTLSTLLPLMMKHRGMTWKLLMCLTDVGSFLSNLTKSSPRVTCSGLFFFLAWNKTDQMIWIDVCFIV